MIFLACLGMSVGGLYVVNKLIDSNAEAKAKDRTKGEDREGLLAAEV